MKTIRAILICSFAAFLASCATVGQKIIERPKVDLERVGVKNATGDGATVLFGVRVQNPNPFALQVDSVKYQIEMAGKHLTSGTIDQPARVGAKEAALIEIPIMVRYADVVSSLFDLVQNKASKYRIKGEASFGLLAIPFDETGELKLKQ